MTEENNDLRFKAPSVPTGQTQQVATEQPAQQPASSMGQAPQQATAFVRPSSASLAVSSAEGGQSPQVQVEKVNYDNNFAADFNLPPKVLQTKFFLMIACAILILGMLFGCVMAPGGSSAPQQSGGLAGVVENPIFQRVSVYRCGAEQNVNQACVLYIMNAKVSDKLGRDFFQEAANITGVPVHTIRINNVDYAEKLIRPGYIAQIYIPKR